MISAARIVDMSASAHQQATIDDDDDDDDGKREQLQDTPTPIALESTSSSSNTATSNSTDNITSKDAAGAESDIELGSIDNDEMRSSRRIRKGYDKENTEMSNTATASQWDKPLTPDENHTNTQYLPPSLSRSFTYILSLPIIEPVARYISGPSRFESSQPRLWNIKFIDQYVEKPLIRYTKKYTRFPIMLWIFLIAWFLGFTFLARAAWWNSGVGNEAEWLSGTSTYWQRNDGCGLGESFL